ncbi:SNF7 family protein, partial [Entamoeba invadens IP1]
MGVLFSKPDDTFQQVQFEVQIQRDELVKTEKKYTLEITNYGNKAKELNRVGDRENALRVLKLRKIRQRQLTEVTNQRNNIEIQVCSSF